MPASDDPEFLPARQADLGGGLKVTRALPTAQRRTVGAWCFLDHAGPAQVAVDEGMRVGPHPHIGLQTFTWMIEGELLHRDSLGSEQVIRPGQVNLMTAGRGIAHSEESVGGGALHAAQLWIALPDAQRECAPAFEHHPEQPVGDAGGFQVTVLVGEALGLRAAPRVHTPLLGVDLVAPADARTEWALDLRFEHALMCLSGRARVAGHALTPDATLYLPPGRAGVALAAEAGTRLLLIGGEPFGAPPLIWWNFVARTPDELVAAAEDWNAGRHFGAVTGTALPRIPAPDARGIKFKTGAGPAR